MLTFNLKKEWFEKIKSGEKTHEYRVFSSYWVKRITNAFKIIILISVWNANLHWDIRIRMTMPEF